MQLLLACIAMILSVFVLTPSVSTKQDQPKISNFIEDIQPIQYTELIELRSFDDLNISEQQEVRCLTHNIYFEARGEPEDGQIAVALVTLNRVESNKFPKTICEVVKERRRTTCQFSWWCEDNLRHASVNNRFYDPLLYNEVEQVALNVFLDRHQVEDITGGALFYHATYVSRHKLGRMKIEPTTTIGQHIFYRMSNE